MCSWNNKLLNITRVCTLIMCTSLFRVFPVLWKIAKIFLDPKTRAKCIILKTSELHKLCEYFNPEHLPEEFGGTCKCENGCLPPIPTHMVRIIPLSSCAFNKAVLSSFLWPALQSLLDCYHVSCYIVNRRNITNTFIFGIQF